MTQNQRSRCPAHDIIVDPLPMLVLQRMSLAWLVLWELPQWHTLQYNLNFNMVQLQVAAARNDQIPIHE